MLNSLLESIKKRAEKSIITNVVSYAMIAKANYNFQQTKNAVRMECASVQDNMKRINENLSHSIKGQFGNQVREKLKNETERMKEL